jgi:hypothetical protein
VRTSDEESRKQKHHREQSWMEKFQ